MERQELFVCECHDVSHQLILSTLDGESNVYGEFHLDNYGFWNRVGNATKYLIGMERKDGDFDAMYFKREDIDRLQWFVDFLGGKNIVDLPEKEPVVTQCKEFGKEWKDTEFFKWTFESKDNAYTVTASKRECISEPELNLDNSIDILICVSMKSTPFYKRMARAAKHIFGYRSCYGDFDSFELTSDAAAPLKRLIDIVRKNRKEDRRTCFSSTAYD